MKPLLLSGLDAQNPLGFFAALGLLRVLDYHAIEHSQERPHLSFVDEGRQTPQIWTTLSMDEVVGVVLEDAAAAADSVALGLAYDDEGNRLLPDAAGATRDLKPTPCLARAILEEVAGGNRRTADLVAGFFSELVQDNNGNTKPTALHFTAGQQSFLGMIDELRRGITAADIREALNGPWLNTSTLPSLSWDASVTRLYALRAGNPSKEKRGSIAGAYWLGVHALSFFPVTAQRGKLVTARVKGGWKDSVLTWPVWDASLSAPTVASLLRTDSSTLRSSERAAYGITAVFSSKILRSDQGGYGSFCPAEVVLSRSAKPQSGGSRSD